MGNVYQAGPLVGIAQLGLRGQVGRFYVTATGGYFQNYYKYEDIMDLSDIWNSLRPTLFGAGVELAYVTPVGPVKVLGTWSPRNAVFAQDAGLYISLGFDF